MPERPPPKAIRTNSKITAAKLQPGSNSMADEPIPLLTRALAVWFILIGVEFIHGVLRVILLVPVVGDLRARQVGVFVGSLLILVVAYFSVRWLRATTTRSLFFVGVLWLALTVLFEFGFGHFVFRRSWEDLASDFNIARGGLLPFGLVVLTFSPVIAARVRRRT